MSDMPAEEFRRAGYQVIDWIAGYLHGVSDRPVLGAVKPGDVTDALPAKAPDEAESIDAILADFDRLIVPNLNHWNHPRFHAFFSISSSGPGILAEALTAALNVNNMVWKSAPAATELEQVTLSWLREWMGLPPAFFGQIFDTASISTLHALAAARELADPETRTRGAMPGLTVYTSEQAHSSVEKGAIALGFGQDNVRKIAVDAEFRMLPSALREALVSDVRNGKTPCCVVPTVGTTSTTSIDPVAEVAEVTAEYRAWLHVDAAYGGVAAILPELRHILNGSECAHSLVVNPHKWLFTPVDCSVLYCCRPEILRRAFSLVPEYLRTADDPRAVNFMDYGVPLGRRFRSLKLWFVMRYFGYDGVCRIVRDHVSWTRELAEAIEEHPSFEICAPFPLSLICFRFRGTDAENQALLNAINASGEAFLSHTVLNGRFVLRLAVGNVRTTRQDLWRVWSAVQAHASASVV